MFLIFYSIPSFGQPATKTGGANGEVVDGTRLRGVRHNNSYFCFGRQSRRYSPLRVA
jgi:hypothetical protein